ncbi:MAG: hypothetical protein CL608_31500 [Anaerolineaceae bacterium]|nr:hypothetical protein [Anaerolineaceae bacterium]
MKAVIFDLGNVLVNYDGVDTFTAVSQLASVSLDEIHGHYKQHEHAFGTGQLSGPAYYQKLDEAFGLSASYDRFAAAFCRNQQRNEAALAFACELQGHANVTVGIISNTNEVHAGWLHANLPELDQFNSVILSNEVGLLKPDPAIYELALNQLDISAEQALFVDDLAENVAGGTAVGLNGHLHKDWPRTRHFIENWLKS